MTTKKFLTTWASTTVALLAVNGVFHGLFAAGFFDKNYEGLGAAALKMSDLNPAPIVVLELLLSFCLTWILSKTYSERSTLRDAVTIGALFHLSSSATYNLVNMATLVSWPLQLVAVDVIWHILMGALAGWLIYRLGLKNRAI